MRSICAVLQKIVAAISDDFESRELFISELRLISEAAKYRAPEDCNLFWHHASLCLAIFLGEPDTEWKKKISDIFSGKEAA
jgi:hypothetical protein